MQHVRLIVFVGLALCLAGAPAFAAGTHSLDSVDHGKTRSLDSADDGETDSLDEVDDGRTDSLDSVDDGRTVSDDSVDVGATHTLDSADDGRTRSLDSSEDGEGWQVPDCDEVSVEIPSPLPGNDARGWSARLSEARRAVTDSKARLETADAEYTRAITLEEWMGQNRADIIESRDQARTAYSRARCALPQLVESAREAGVEPGVYRAYE